MSLHRFFLETQVLAAEEAGAFPLRLAEDDQRHVKALRLTPGEHIAVIDAVDDYFECEVVSVGDGALIVRISQHLDPPAMPSVVLAQGLSKGDKMDEVIRHATELGVAAFVPLACERSVVRLDERKAAKRVARWRAVAKSAAMQSGQPRIPEVGEPMSVDEVCTLFAECSAVIICWEEAPGTASLREALFQALAHTSTPPADARVAVVVGPEGGLAETEVNRLLACNRNAALVTLGPSILRTETAGVVAPALVLYELGCLGAASLGA